MERSNTMMHRWLQIGDDLSLAPAKDIPPTGMAVATVPILVVLLFSLLLKLGNVQTLLIASARCVAQLMLLGLILYPVLRYNKPYVTLPYILVMVLFATREASVKPKLRYRRMPLHIFLAVLVSLALFLSLISFGVLQPDPWYDAQVIIPVAGMMLGSCVNALSLGIDRFLLSMWGQGNGSANLQTFLACGATRWEASIAAVRQAIETGMTPNLNQMSVMGLVSIPGMLTGQLLAGTSPLVAAKYQIVIMFFVCSNSTVVLFLTLLQAIFFGLFDKTYHAFRPDVVHQRTGGKPKDALLALLARIVHLFGSIFDIKRMESSNPDDDIIICQHSKIESYGTFLPLDNSRSGNQTSSKTLLKMTNGEIKVHGIDRPLLTKLNLQIDEEDIVLLSGPSGCGKSTFLRALALLEAVNGDVLSLHGMKAPGMISTTMWRSQVLYIRQNGGQGLPGTPRDLLPKLHALKTQQASRLQNVEANIVQEVEALDLSKDVMDRPWDLLSGGEAQRLYLCIMLTLRPQILLLDEPTSACDEKAARKLEDLVLKSGIAAVWVSHDAAQMERLEQHHRVWCLRYERLES